MAVMMLQLGIQGTAGMALGPCPDRPQPGHEVYGGLGQGVLQLTGIRLLGVGVGSPVVLHGITRGCGFHAIWAAAWGVLPLGILAGAAPPPARSRLPISLPCLQHLQPHDIVTRRAGWKESQEGRCRVPEGLQILSV